MNNTINFAQTLITQMNNPDCSILTGMTIGNWMSLRYIVLIFVLLIIYSSINFWIKELWIWIKNKYNKRV